MRGNCGKCLCRTATTVVLIGFLGSAIFAAELTQNTKNAFDHYVRIRQDQIAEELRNERTLFWFDQFPEPRRQQIYEQLQSGQILVERLETFEGNKQIKIPNGLVHHWVGAAFIPGATLQGTLDVVQDYDHHEIIYKPDVRRSKLLRRDGDNFHVYLQLYKKTIITTAMNAQFDIRYFTLDGSRAYSQSHSTRIAEVKDLDESGEKELEVGKDHGYLWGMDSFWRFCEKDGGVYIQVESIGLSRGVPMFLEWLVRPLLSRIPRETLSNLLTCTRNTVISRNKIPLAAGNFAYRPSSLRFKYPKLTVL